MEAITCPGGGGRGIRKAKGGCVWGKKGKGWAGVVQVLILFNNPFTKSEEAPENSDLDADR